MEISQEWGDGWEGGNNKAVEGMYGQDLWGILEGLRKWWWNEVFKGNWNGENYYEEYYSKYGIYPNFVYLSSSLI